MTPAERKAWNAAIEAAAGRVEDIVDTQLDLSRNHEAGLIPTGTAVTMMQIPFAIRSLTKPEAE